MSKPALGRAFYAARLLLLRQVYRARSDNAAKNCRICFIRFLSPARLRLERLCRSPCHFESHRFDPETNGPWASCSRWLVWRLLSDRTDVASEIIATRIIQRRMPAQCDADLLCEGALTFLRGAQGRGPNWSRRCREAIGPLRSGTERVVIWETRHEDGSCRGGAARDTIAQHDGQRLAPPNHRPGAWVPSRRLRSAAPSTH